MFKKMASDALGLSDIGKIIDPADYDQTDADDYVRHEDGETIYFLIKTKAEEYCFTNLAVIHVEGENATTSKRTLNRYPYAHYNISNVLLETAGKIDMDVEIKFMLGNEHYSIDVHKDDIDQLKYLYKALLDIAETIHENEAMMAIATQSLDKAAGVLEYSRTSETDLAAQYKELTNYSFSWLKSARDQYHRKDFGEIFEKYSHN